MAPDEKGWELEIAVEAIEAVILESSPSLLGQPFHIERRKRINVGGVHHEIDIFVQGGAAKGYESTFIFECKPQTPFRGELSFRAGYLKDGYDGGLVVRDRDFGSGQ